MFSQTSELQQQYTVAVKNSYQVLEEDNNNERFNKFVAANIKAREEIVPEKGRKKTAIRSNNPAVIEARNKSETVHREWEANKSEANKEAWKQALRTRCMIV